MGSLRPTLSLEHFDKNGLRGRSVAFGIKLMDDISVNGYISEGIMVTLSPFVFRRFETDMYSKTLALLSEIVSMTGITSI